MVYYNLVYHFKNNEIDNYVKSQHKCYLSRQIQTNESDMQRQSGRFKVNRRRGLTHVPVCDNTLQTFFTKRQCGRVVNWTFNMSQYKVSTYASKKTVDELGPLDEIVSDSHYYEQLHNAQQIELEEEETNAEQLKCGETLAISEDEEDHARTPEPTPSSPLPAYKATPRAVLEERSSVKRKTSSNPRIQTEENHQQKKKKKKPALKKAAQTTPKRTLLDLIMFMFPTLMLHQVPSLIKTVQDLVISQDLTGELSNVYMTFWRAIIGFQRSQSPSTTSFQDYLTTRPDTTLELRVTGATETHLIQSLLPLLTSDQGKAVRQPQGTNNCSSSATTRLDHPGTTSIFSTPVRGATPSVDADDSGPSNTYKSVDLSPRMFEAFLPRTSGALRSITFSVGNRTFTQRYPANNGEFLVKTEIYRTSEVSQIPTREWWKYALHRSQVFMDREEEEFKLATQIAERQRTKWVSPEGVKLHQEVELTGGIRPDPPRPQAPTFNTGAWGAPNANINSW